MINWSAWRTEKPTFVPPGYKFLADAGEMIAQTHFGEAWIGREFGFEPHHVASYTLPDPKMQNADKLKALVLDTQPRHRDAVRFWYGMRLEVPTTEEWEAAYSRFSYAFVNQSHILARKDAACDLIQHLAASADLVIEARNQATGLMVPLEPRIWNCEPSLARKRMAACKVNLLNPMQPYPQTALDQRRWEALQSSWLFVSDVSLERAIAHLSPPASKVAVASKANAETKAEAWLRGRFAETEETRCMAKADFQAQAKELFDGLSDRAFERAWGKAGADFPERRLAGPKRRTA